MTMQPGVLAAHWTFFFNTEAIDEAAERIEKAGGTVTLAPIEVPGGQWIIERRRTRRARASASSPTGGRGPGFLPVLAGQHFLDFPMGSWRLTNCVKNDT